MTKAATYQLTSHQLEAIESCLDLAGELLSSRALNMNEIPENFGSHERDMHRIHVAEYQLTCEIFGVAQWDIEPLEQEN